MNYRTKFDDEAEARIAVLVKSGVSEERAFELSWEAINRRAAVEQGVLFGEPNA